MSKTNRDSKLSREKGGKLVKTDPFLHTEKSRKKWYKPENLGKQGKKPKQRIKE
ncbi:unnamed protein product [marine sediment metagenome]|uniref:Uncharacterized protein n=1 Tax=marine sediment metagenome TaxID=412755 RepID=X1FII2_9ZZZZ